jgi:hypothetical protein
LNFYEKNKNLLKAVIFEKSFSKDQSKIVPLLKSIRKIKNLIDYCERKDPKSLEDANLLEISYLMNEVDKEIDALLKEKERKLEPIKDPLDRELFPFFKKIIYKLGLKTFYEKPENIKKNDSFEKLNKKILTYINFKEVVVKGKEKLADKAFSIAFGVAVLTITVIALKILIPVFIKALSIAALMVAPMFIMMGGAAVCVLLLILLGMGLIYFGVNL